ncbi:uncharacterized protein LOC117586414 [Drosophila guanche]|uniref:uncharacterized protein LOC117586414 n=1 Tax=Drosophila guanche TaxID=7266 RepID=UPI001470AD00|nr:uncharacterized protein LOC117586414 [Drosophila guanche]
MPPQTKDEHPCTEAILIPEWVKPVIFQDLLKQQVKDYKETNSLRASAGVAKGENYATIMLRVELDVEIEDKSQVTKAYMLKIAHDSDAYRKILEKSNIFDTERGMYLKIVPEMEKMYRDVGLEVKFGAQSYEIPTNENYVLLEDLKPQGFKNVDRLQGSLLKYIEHYEGRETYLKDLLSISEKLDDIATKIIESNPDEFNALNHGDGWCNNIMYQYNEKNEISNTYFVDLQLPKWGSVAQDLYYFLISSTSLDIKTSKFDYFIWFYHSELVKHLQLLKYSKPLPTLRGIRNDLSKHSGWGLVCCTSIMGFVLLDPIVDDNGDFDKLLSQEDSSFKKSMFTNTRFRKHVEVLLPWLQHRGAMEYN